MILTHIKTVTPESGRPYHVATVTHEGELVEFNDRGGVWAAEDDNGRVAHALPEVAAYLQEELLLHDKAAVQDRRKIKAVVVSAEAMGEVAREEQKQRRTRRRVAA